MRETVTATDKHQNDMPTSMRDITVSVRQTFGIDSDLQVPTFLKDCDCIPDIDDAYRFDGVPRSLPPLRFVDGRARLLPAGKHIKNWMACAWKSDTWR